MLSLRAERLRMKSIKSDMDWKEKCMSSAIWYKNPKEILE